MIGATVSRDDLVYLDYPSFSTMLIKEGRVSLVYLAARFCRTNHVLARLDCMINGSSLYYKRARGSPTNYAGHTL